MEERYKYVILESYQWCLVKNVILEVDVFGIVQMQEILNGKKKNTCPANGLIKIRF